MGLSPTHAMVETPSREFYREAMEFLSRARVPFLVGGTFAFVHQAGIDRSTKDLDIFVRPADVHRCCARPPRRGTRRTWSSRIGWRRSARRRASWT